MFMYLSTSRSRDELPALGSIPTVRKVMAPEVTRAGILLVDDRPENILGLKAALEPLDQELISASSGEDALRLLLDRDVAVILLDVNLPGMNGFEAAALIRDRERTRYTPIIFLTAMDSHSVEVSRGYSLGAVDFLFKPLDIDVLRAKVSVFVELYLKTLEIRRLNNDLEFRVMQRTMELERTNHELQNEVAERARAEEEIRQLNTILEQRVLERTSDLEAANQELEAFSYSVSHDLRAPLRRLDGLSKMFIEDYGSSLDEGARSYVNRIATASQQMSQIIDDLLTLSQVTRNELHREEVDLSYLVREITAELSHARPAPRVEVSIQKEVVVQGDRRFLRLALRNLLENAWKFTSRSESPRVEFGATQNDSELVCFVQDNGAGFDMAYADQIFSAFERLHPSSEYPGTGIGLAIARRVVQRHGGRIWAESQVGNGASFYFTLA